MLLPVDPRVDHLRGRDGAKLLIEYAAFKCPSDLRGGSQVSLTALYPSAIPER